MALNLRPVGPEPEATYWARRAVLVAVLLLVVLLLGQLLSSSGGTDTVATATPTPRPPASGAPSAGPSASASPSPSAPVACTDAVLEVQARAEQDSYAVTGRPLLMLSVTNTGDAPCTRDLGQAAVELLVVSGDDRIWSSDDCAPGGPAGVEVLEPGEPSRTQVTWPGRRSLPGCAGPQADAEAGTYRVGARVGELRVQGSAFRLTG